jgi:alpha-galactosidase
VSQGTYLRNNESDCRRGLGRCKWSSLGGIIDHWGDYGLSLQPFAGPGHWHDMDMLLIGAISGGHDGGQNGTRCVSLEEEQTQMAIWSISASPLIMGNDMRTVAPESLKILLNKDAIAVSQDPLGQMGIRISPNIATQIWARKLANGDVAVALYNKGDPQAAASAAPASITVEFGLSGIDLDGAVTVYDIWEQKVVGTFHEKYTATGVPFHGTAFLRLSN